MHRRTISIAALAIAVTTIAFGAFVSSAGAGGRPLDAVLTGAAEAPGPGDPDGSGSAHIRLNPGQRTVCFELEWSGIEPPQAAHIHVGPVGVAGPVVVGFFGPPTGAPVRESGCVEGVERDLVRAIIKRPEQYYVNIHTPSFGAGAIRGQLSK